MQRYFLSLPLLLLFCAARAQQFTDSNLPIILINTDNVAPIPDEPGVWGTMKVIRRGQGQRNYVTDKDSAEFLDYNGRINIETRGSYSQVFPKKGFGFTTLQDDDISNNNVKLLGMPSENDWILNGLSSDPALMRDYLGMKLARATGQYASRVAYCEVVVNGDYRGLYVLEEKIKPDKNRVNILKIEDTDNAAPEVTGGYLTKTDKPTGGDPTAWTMPSYAQFETANFIHSWPEPDLATTPQTNYIRSVFFNLQTACTAGNSAITTGFPSIIDIPSFVDFMLVNELAGNVDAYTFSTYYHKDRNGKLRAGPVWDFNLTFGNDLFEFGVARSKPDVWQFSDGGNEGPKYLRDLFNNPVFKCYMARRWNELTQPGQPFHLTELKNLVDSTKALISEAVVRNNLRWNITSNHQLAVDTLKGWMQLRLPWITGHIGTFSACSNITTPPLVISRIHYHPDSTAAFPDENKLEFIEISNAGTSAVDLTGIYFGGTGLAYVFPNGASLPAGAALTLASDAVAFQQRFGAAPFGQFTRNLSNSDQRLQLLDAFGNEIDRVHYRDNDPWPDADGNGKYLQLISLDLDNSLASSWQALDEQGLVGTQAPARAPLVYAYPNPTREQVRIHTALPMESIILSDPQGRILSVFAANSPEFTLNTAQLPVGLYFVRVATREGMGMVKLVKE